MGAKQNQCGLSRFWAGRNGVKCRMDSINAHFDAEQDKVNTANDLWRASVIDAYEKGQVDTHTQGISNDAYDVISRHKTEKTKQKQAAGVASEMMDYAESQAKGKGIHPSWIPVIQKSITERTPKSQIDDYIGALLRSLGT